MRRAALAVALTLACFALARADEDEDEAPAALAPEARLAVAIAKGEVIRGKKALRYAALLGDGDVTAWNEKRQADGFRLLDLAGRTWGAENPDDLALALEGQDLRGIDLSNVIFAPGTSFRFSNLAGARFRGSCLDGVTFSSVHGFEARGARGVAATSLANADLRDVAWTWCTALERTAARVRKERGVQRAPVARARPGPPFAFAELEGVKADDDAPLLPRPDESPSGKTLAKLARAAREGALDRAIERLATRHRAVRTRPVTNPLRAEPALAAAIAATSSALEDVAEWKAVAIAEPRAGDEPVVFDSEKLLLVVDDRSAASIRLLVARGPVFAGRRAQLPPTFSASVVVLKDQGRPLGIVHGSVVFALTDGLRGPQQRHLRDTAGTFLSPVVDEVSGARNLTEAESDRRTLEETRLLDYAAAQGDVDQNTPPFDPAKSDSSEEALSDSARKAIRDAVGKEALDGMRVVELAPPAGRVRSVVCSDPKVVLVVPVKLQFHGAIYAEGPIVLSGSNKARHWFTRVVSRSWIGVRGTRPRTGQLVHLGTKVDLDEEEEAEKAEKPK